MDLAEALNIFEQVPEAGIGLRDRGGEGDFRLIRFGFEGEFQGLL